MAEQEMVHYRATSTYVDPQNLANGILAILALVATPEYSAILPAGALKWVALLTPIINILIRHVFVQRPVAFITPGTSTPVEVKKLLN